MLQETWEHEGTLSFTIYGVPRPQGSMRAFVNKRTGKAHVTGSKTNKEWRSTVLKTVKAHLPPGHTPYGELIVMDVRFYFAYPKSMPKWKREITTKMNGSDLDKLVRSIGDALTDAGVYEDDRQIQRITASKWYTDDEPRAEVTVRAYSVNEKALRS